MPDPTRSDRHRRRSGDAVLASTNRERCKLCGSRDCGCVLGRAPADPIAAEMQRFSDAHRWKCEDCGCMNGGHEAFCFLCGAGGPDV